jgi:hypothetical protein
LQKLHVYYKNEVLSGILRRIFIFYDIDIHKLNVGPFRGLKFLDEISFKKCVVFSFLNNKCIRIYVI